MGAGYAKGFRGQPHPLSNLRPGLIMKSKTIAAVAAAAALLLSVSVASVAEATTYELVDQTFRTQCGAFPACPVTGSLTGTITTDGTFGVGLSPSIITGWNFWLDDGLHPAANLTSSNSFITYNFSNLLSATRHELDFNFSP